MKKELTSVEPYKSVGSNGEGAATTAGKASVNAPSVAGSEPPEPKRLRKVAIVGGGPTRRLAPYHKKSWEIWAFSSSKYRYRRVDRWFEIHHIKDLRQQLHGHRKGRRTFRDYMRYMRRLKCPVYMMKKHPKIPNSVTFPKKELVEEFGPCFTSTASWMLALAIKEGYDVIGLWGINPKGKEYGRQRAALRYLLSVAKARGIKLVFPKNFRMKVPTKVRPVTTRVLYAYGWRSRKAWWRERVWRRLKRKRKRKARRLRRRRR